MNTKRHNISIPKKIGKRLQKKQKERDLERKKRSKRLSESTRQQLDRRPRATQLILTQYFQSAKDSELDPLAETELINEPIGPTGDVLIDKDPGITRFGLQNIMGLSIKEGHRILPETVAIHALQLDYIGITEPNRVLTKETRQRISNEINYFAGKSRLVCSSSPKVDTGSDYSHGGTILGVVGAQVGRVLKCGSDKWGRFSWTTLQGTRDEGILVMTIYRVPQKREQSRLQARRTLSS